MSQDLSVAVKDRHEERTSAWLFEPPSLMLPSQYFGVIQSREQLTPEKKLLFAVLESAVHDCQRYRLATGKRGQRLFREAYEWLTAREETGICSCVAICHAVGIDPDYVRRGTVRMAPEEAESRRGSSGEGEPCHDAGPPRRGWRC
jgi:hypothetical protein